MMSQTIWDFWAGLYEGLWVQKHSLAPSRKAIIRALAPMLEKDRQYRLLDMGCGTGQLLRECQTAFAEYDLCCTGVDFSSKMIEKCRERDPGTVYIVSSIDDFVLSEGKGGFDFIICAHSFPYYADKMKAVEKFHQLLNHDGRLFLVQASANSIYDHIAMFFVKFTTGKAEYLSIKGIFNLVQSHFQRIDHIRIKERQYMPTICLFLLQKAGGQ
jgi:ubiquinone/menaquinone biosynthesis C-methylase UbiE